VLHGVLCISPKLETRLYARAVRYILKLVFVSVILIGSALAQGAPLIGSSASFINSGYCKTVGCDFVGKIPITTTLIEYRYWVKFLIESEFPKMVVSVFRDGDTVVSVGFSVDGQDIPFSTENPKEMKPALELFRVATGVTLSAAAFLNLQNSCDHFTTMLGAFKLTCATSSDAFDAQRWNYRIFR
jgi:hypothetical protein